MCAVRRVIGYSDSEQRLWFWVEFEGVMAVQFKVTNPPPCAPECAQIQIGRPQGPPPCSIRLFPLPLGTERSPELRRGLERRQEETTTKQEKMILRVSRRNTHTTRQRERDKNETPRECPPPTQSHVHPIGKVSHPSKVKLAPTLWAARASGPRFAVSIAIPNAPLTPGLGSSSATSVSLCGLSLLRLWYSPKDLGV